MLIEPPSMERDDGRRPAPALSEGRSCDNRTRTSARSEQAVGKGTPRPRRLRVTRSRSERHRDTTEARRILAKPLTPAKVASSSSLRQIKPAKIRPSAILGDNRGTRVTTPAALHPPQLQSIGESLG